MVKTSNATMTTEEIILETAIDLMEKKGFKAVTTKEIAAESGFSEMTLFRHFGTKQALLERAVETHSYLIDMKAILYDNVSYNLKEDLKRVSETYHKYNQYNYKIVLLSYQERHTHPFIGEQISENPKRLKMYLVDYFKEMQKQGKVVECNAEAQAMNFLWMNLGFFIARHLGGQKVSHMPLESFIEESVTLFVQGLEVREP
ncbi:TetR/AcrR family transcriptional regulator [Salipaludibacillus agaradhaerens]|uniref:TetR/AcrR family transcriptional regulator n=1 Tax=Salipaludibacillus agaradhaerens TaxID=76935 RepID=UPI0021510FD1|nr:TetR/AcrR family transcriptional regulator [Salipaludibacillus agaradhaerens]MCR6107401.1 TetR/AcrR family transcriptional regulator [Salipaludibacillus agaradhaerens]MCR6119430.1 TetR/AcrR family transcriptional regulator [Salipaludibacillus agaradhaerens]UJW58459.1 TetR/AcrR family transcriptional regulator [Bacillus sp. A116_S68]